MSQYKFLRGSLNPFNAALVSEHNRRFREAHPEYFDLDGILAFCGGQGQGKTISAVSYVLKLLSHYTELVLCSNVEIAEQVEFAFVNGLDIEGDRVQNARVQKWLGERELGKRCVIAIPYDSVERLTDVNNGYGGVVYLIDEFQLEFNSLESKQMDSNIFYAVSQQRKQRKHIVGTTQVFNRIAKPFREQFKYMVSCRCHFRCLQVNKLVDALNSYEENGKLVAEKLKTFVWFHRPELYESYDTLQLIRRTRAEWVKGG